MPDQNNAIRNVNISNFESKHANNSVIENIQYNAEQIYGADSLNINIKHKENEETNESKVIRDIGTAPAGKKREKGTPGILKKEAMNTFTNHKPKNNEIKFDDMN